MLEIRCSNSDMSERFLCSPIHPVRLRVSRTIPYSGYRGSFPGVKRSGREANHSSPYSAVVINEWGNISAPPICLHGVGRDSCVFFATHIIPMHIHIPIYSRSAAYFNIVFASSSYSVSLIFRLMFLKISQLAKHLNVILFSSEHHLTSKAQLLLYILRGLTFRNFTFCPHGVWISEQTAIISLYSAN